MKEWPVRACVIRLRTSLEVDSKWFVVFSDGGDGSIEEYFDVDRAQVVSQLSHQVS